MDLSPEQHSPLSRRRILQTAAGLTSLGIFGDSATMPVAAAPVAAAPGTVLWEFETKFGIQSSPTVVDGTVFVGSDDSNLYAVEAATGKQEWAFETENSVDTSPAVMDGTIFIGNSEANLHAVDAATGEQEWVFEAGWTSLSSPAVADGTVYIGSWDRNLYAVDAATGEQEWTYDTGDRINSSPTVVNGTVFVGSNDNNLHAVDAATGEQEWAFKTEDSVRSSPAVVDTGFVGSEDGTVYVGSRDSNLYAVDAATGDQRWAFETGGAVYASPTVVDGTVYVGSRDSNLYAVDAATGDQRWAFETGGEVYSPTVADGTVLVGSWDGNLYAVDATTGEQEWALDVDAGAVESAPTVADGTVFIGNAGGNLYAVVAERSDIAGIELTVDTTTLPATGEDTVTITAQLVDDDGYPVRKAGEDVAFSISNRREARIRIETFDEETDASGKAVLELSAESPGSKVTIAVTSSGLAAETTLNTVEPARANFTVEADTVPVDIVEGSSYTVSSTVTNEGDAAGSQDVDYELQQGDAGFSEVELTKEDVKLDAGESQEVAFTLDSETTNGLEINDDYAHFFGTADDDLKIEGVVVRAPSEGSELDKYTGKEGYVDYDGLRDAASDYRNGDINAETFKKVASVFRSGEPLS